MSFSDAFHLKSSISGLYNILAICGHLSNFIPTLLFSQPNFLPGVYIYRKIYQCIRFYYFWKNIYRKYYFVIKWKRGSNSHILFGKTRFSITILGKNLRTFVSFRRAEKIHSLTYDKALKLKALISFPKPYLAYIHFQNWCWECGQNIFPWLLNRV